jgi:hypothetical protein
VHDFRRFIVCLPVRCRFCGVLFPEERVTRKGRFRKFIYQKGDIGNSDI